MKETAYLLQAALISTWWVGLALSENFFAAFQYEGFAAASFWSFFAPDIVLIAGLSATRAYWKNRNLEFVVLGAFGYAALYCCNASFLTRSGYLPTGLMLCGFFYNVFLCFNGAMFRSANSGLLFTAAKTLIQIVCIWLIALLLIPYVILDAFGHATIPGLSFQSIIGLLLFVLCSALGLTSAYFMVRDGKGTPLPLDQTNELVVSGPYHFVRNPMAIAGIGQGISISIVFLSIPILVYSLLGAAVWHLVVRPIEEKDMAERFGESYREYRDRVSCWWPRFRDRVG